MTCFPDVNVWVALCVANHLHHTDAAKWFDSVPGSVAFCRVTQMGLLRLLTNRHVLGADALSAERAWKVFDALANDDRVGLFDEPPDMEVRWRNLTRRRAEGTNFWTDAYLAAFATSREFILVTFDKQLARLRGTETILLGR